LKKQKCEEEQESDDHIWRPSGTEHEDERVEEPDRNLDQSHLIRLLLQEL
jgi:hypothetical protein